MVFLVCFGFFAFGDTGEQGTSAGVQTGQGSPPEEIDFLLFAPNSSSQFVNQDQAMIQLDNLAKFLRGRDPVPGQIAVYGYAAAASNNIEPVNLSKDRALFVINELQKRGVSKELFSDPVGYGEVNLWGGNTNEQNRSPNRRVRILLDGNILTPSTLKAAEPAVTISSIDSNPKAAAQENDTGSKFPWKILLLLLIIALLAAMIYFLSRNKRKSSDKVVPAAVAPGPIAAAAIPVAAVAVAVSYSTVNLDEEIRLRAYGLYEERYGQNGNAEGDWYKAVIEICAKYEASGYETYTETYSWWARRPI